MRVGLLGGSFNPPHQGHVHVALTALRMLKLDCVWWLVSPQNPLKSAHETAPMKDRLEQCLTITAPYPSLVVSDIERATGTGKTYDTLRLLSRRFRYAEFVWIAGMDNAIGFHRWHRWRDIPDLASLAFIGRPPARSLVRHAPVAMLSYPFQRVISSATQYSLKPGNIYWIPENPLNPAASTSIRQNGSTKKIFAPGT